MIDMKNTSTVDLETMRDELESKLIEIRNQLDRAKCKANADNEYSDSKWFCDAKYALKKTGQQHQQILREISGRNKVVRNVRENSLNSVFIRVAKRNLPREIFMECISEAKDEMEASSYNIDQP